ncbi:hypothetical protein VTI74DRAFT_978 [Chaetomium olivicolor]
MLSPGHGRDAKLEPPHVCRGLMTRPRYPGSSFGESTWKWWSLFADLESMVCFSLQSYHRLLPTHRLIALRHRSMPKNTKALATTRGPVTEGGAQVPGRRRLERPSFWSSGLHTSGLLFANDTRRLLHMPSQASLWKGWTNVPPRQEVSWRGSPPLDATLLAMIVEPPWHATRNSTS